MNVKRHIYTRYREAISESSCIEVLVVRPLHVTDTVNRDTIFELHIDGRYIDEYSKEEIELIVGFLKEVIKDE